MATETRESAPHLTDQDVFPPEDGVYGRLFREGPRFSFFQAVRLLEKYFPDAPAPGESIEVRRERILFRPYPAMVFPASDVRTIEALTEPFPRVQLQVTFMGLYGVASPLPVYFYEDIASEHVEVEPLRDFLDIFNHRLYAYFYRTWKKYRPTERHGVKGEDKHTGRFFSVAGLGTDAAIQKTPVVHPLRLTAFASWLSPRVRSAEGLRKFLSGMLEDVPVLIEENVMRRVKLPDRPKMGEPGGGFSLGSSAVVGQTVKDRSGKFRVVLGPLSFRMYRSFLPGHPRARLLHYLIRLYAPDYLDFDVELQLDTSQIPPVRLGNSDVQLGLTTWLGRPEHAITKQQVQYE